MNGVCGDASFIDECGTCAGGGTEIVPNEDCLDECGNPPSQYGGPGGAPCLTCDCGECNGVFDCTGVTCLGQEFDQCGICDGPNTTNCLPDGSACSLDTDCAGSSLVDGVIGYCDYCNICGGPNTTGCLGTDSQCSADTDCANLNCNACSVCHTINNLSNCAANGDSCVTWNDCASLACDACGICSGNNNNCYSDGISCSDGNDCSSDYCDMCSM